MTTIETVSSDREGAQDFLAHQGVLWRTLVKLARRGHYVPPDEANDVIHDFYLEAWDGLLERYEASLSAFPTYLAGAFFRFAKRRLAEMEDCRSRLIDLDVAVDLVSPEPSPIEKMESAQEAHRIRNALQKLPGHQRQILVLYVMNEIATERDLAERMKSSRHYIRKTLAEGLANLAEAYECSGPPNPSVLILKYAWQEGRVSGDIAERVGLPARTVQEKRREFARNALAILREGTQKSSAKRSKNMEVQMFFRQAVLADDREIALQDLRKMAEQIRMSIVSEEIGEVHFTPDEEAFLRRHPQRLAEVYDILYPETESEYEDTASRAVAAFERNRKAELASAFEDMVASLPSSLVDWASFLPAMRITQSEIDWLLEKGDYTSEAGQATSQIARFGLTPEVFAEIFGGFSLLLEQAEQDPIQLEDDDKISLLIRRQGAIHPVSFAELVAYTQESPGLPNVEGMAEGLTQWTLEAVRLLPLLVPKYKFEVEGEGVPVAQRSDDIEMSLNARWTHRAIDQPALRRGFGFRR